MISKLNHLTEAHPDLSKLFAEVAKHVAIQVLDSKRGEAAQMLAVHTGRSKVTFGNSAHNYVPSIAVDVVPLPLDWSTPAPFIRLAQDWVLPLAKKMGIPIRWGGDWNMNGKTTDETFIDLPHYELHPWREYAKSVTLYRG